MTTQPDNGCDPELYKNGEAVMVIEGMASTAVEAQVQRWRETLGVPIDWYQAGGRARVVCNPKDIDEVRTRLKHFQPRVQFIL